jgi:DNA-binding beta-propeller fold protein YncE
MLKMRGKALGLVGIVAALATAWGRPAQAKDRFYTLGQGMIQVIDGDRDAIVAKIPLRGWTREAAITSDKKFMYVTANRHLIHKVSLADDKVVATVDVSGDGWDRFIFGFTMAGDDRTAFAAMMSRTTRDGEAVVGAPVVAQVDLASGKIVRSVEVPWGVARLVTVKGGQQVYALGKDIYKIDAAGGALKIVETVPMFDKKWNILPFWDYTWENGGLATTNYYTPEIMGLLTVDEKTGDIGDIPIKGDPVLAYSVIFTPDRKTAYAVMDDLTVIDLENGKYGPVVPLEEGTSYAVNVSSDGRKIYVGPAGASVTIYDATTLKRLKTLQLATDGMDLRRVTF